MSGDRRLADRRAGARGPGPAARYAWPHGDALACRVIGAGRPLIAVGLLPHANEPLGSAFAATATDDQAGDGCIALVGPIDPPPRSHRFPLPCDPVTFAARGYLQPAHEQAEFAHCPDPRTPAQRRATAFRACLRELGADGLVLLHNDPGAQAPYLYANSPWPRVERRLVRDLGTDFPHWGPLEATWTHQISERTYAFFPCESIGITGTESAGVYIERELGIPTLTLELPMFRWGGAVRLGLDYRDALGDWAAAGGACGGDRPGLVRQVARLLAGRDVPMIPPAVNRRAVRSVLRGLRESLVAGQRTQPGLVRR